jgi:hypothetical protein
MDQLPQDPPAAKRLPGPDGRPPGYAAPGRVDGIARVRRWSNGVAAALVVATAMTTGYFARASVSTAPAAASASRNAPGVAGQPGTGTAASKHQPCISVPVATSGGSGVRAQTPVRVCGAGASTGAPIVIYANQGPGQEDS